MITIQDEAQEAKLREETFFISAVYQCGKCHENTFYSLNCYCSNCKSTSKCYADGKPLREPKPRNASNNKEAMWANDMLEVAPILLAINILHARARAQFNKPTGDR